MWLFPGGLVPAAVFPFWVYMCVCACACVRAHWTNTVKPSPTLFEYQSWVFPLPVSESCLLIWRWLVLAREWQAGWVCHQSGPLIGPLHAGETSRPFSEVFCERIWSGGPHRDVMFQVYSLKGGTRDGWFFPVAATLKCFCFYFSFTSR